MILEERWDNLKRVLVVRSCRMEQFYDNIELLKKYLGSKAIIDVLAQPAVKEEIEAKGEINEVLIYDKGFFRVRDISQELWDKIQSDYDAFVILYNEPYSYCKGYHQINRIAALSKAKYICGIDKKGDVFLVSRKVWWLKRLCGFLLRVVIRPAIPIFKGVTVLPIILVVLAIRVLRPLVVIRFKHLYSNRIGHFAANTEVYLCERDAGMHGRRTIDIFYYRKDTPICNQQLKRMWDRTLHISRVGSALARELDRVNRQLPGGENHVIPWRKNQDRDIHGLLSRTQTHLSFTLEEECRGKEELRNIGIPDDVPFVCFHSGNGVYLDNVFPNVNWSYHNYRNANIYNFVSAAEELVRRGYYAIRMGAIVKERLKTTNPKIIDYANTGRNDFLDIFLCAKCRFLLGSTDGLNAVPMIFRRPVAWLNLMPLEYVPSWNFNDLFIPKKLWLREEHRFLTFREILDSEIGRFLFSEQYEQMGIEVIENTPEEITALAVEMDERLKGSWQTTEEDEELQRRFWALFKPSELNQVFLSRIGAEFLRQNRELLE